MNFDTVIIGGGLAGLTAGIRLQAQGVKCAIVSAGHSALHFSSGSFDLLNCLGDGTNVVNPVEAVKQLSPEHPYCKLQGDFARYAEEARTLLIDNGVAVDGDASKNHFRFTPMGKLLPTWLTFSEVSTLDTDKSRLADNILILNFAGFLDFNTRFIADAFETNGAKCQIASISMNEINRLRVSPTEMRASNIAKVFEDDSTLNSLITIVNEKSKGYDCVVLPAVFGFASSDRVDRIRKGVNLPVHILPTMPPSVPGIRTQIALRKKFERLGGVYMLGDTIVKADVKGNEVKCVYSANHDDIPFTAKNFILASGHFFSKGLVATPAGVSEPVFGCDVKFSGNRADWYDEDFFSRQNYISFGVDTDSDFHAVIEGKPCRNLYVIGSILGGCNTLAEGCGAGVSMLTALKVADKLIKG